MNQHLLPSARLAHVYQPVGASGTAVAGSGGPSGPSGHHDDHALCASRAEPSAGWDRRAGGAGERIR
jgi:hypothetical protein